MPNNRGQQKGYQLDLHDIRKEVVYKVGRNVLLFQQMERVLKYLVTHSAFSATASEMASKFDRHKQSVSKRTLGMVVGDFLAGSKPEPAPEVLTEPHLSISFDFELEESVRVQIEALVDERNYLVHHFLEGIDAESKESWVKASGRLDIQEDELDKATDHLRKLAQALSDGRKELAEYMMTEEFKQQLR